MKVSLSKDAAKKSLALILKSPYGELRECISASELDDFFMLSCDRTVDAYASPSGYINWNDYAKMCLVTGSLKSLETCFLNSDILGAVACSTFRSATIVNACARYLSKQIIESFVQTPLPELPLEIMDVLPYVHLMLPRKTVYDVEGDEVISILVQSGKLYSDEISESSLNLTKAFFPEERLAPNELLGAKGVQIVTFTSSGMDVFQEFITTEAKSWHESNVKYTGHSKYADEATEKIIRIALNSLLVHLYEPGLVTTDPRPATKGVGFSAASKQPLSPTWIGKTFKRSVAKKSSRLDPATRASVRSHWRRGHWHSVCVGPKRGERRVQWFKPVYVNPVA